MTEVKPNHGGVYAALAVAQSQMGKALKDANNPHFKSKYADLSNVTDAALPALNANGIAVFQPMRAIDGKDHVVTIFAHSSGETIECAIPLLVNKNDMQGLGSAITYARRYGLMMMAGIAPEDDDGNAAAQAASMIETRQAQFDPAPHIAAIEAANTGKALLAAVEAAGPANSRADITEARVAKIEALVKGAPSIAALAAMEKAFNPDWQAVKQWADMRKQELANDDLGGDEIPYEGGAK